MPGMDNEDLYERPPGPRPSEIRARWASEGDVEALWDVLVNTPWDRKNPFTGEPMTIKAGPARNVVRAVPLKALEVMV